MRTLGVLAGPSVSVRRPSSGSRSEIPSAADVTAEPAFHDGERAPKRCRPIARRGTPCEQAFLADVLAALFTLLDATLHSARGPGRWT